jgi:hypothetical protein
MAEQDFLNGGFIGKLGNFVGQRWKNKRTVRTYVIPADPHTPKQLEHRALFAKIVKLTQEAMIINKGASYWHDPNTTEWALRTSTCNRRLKAGMTDAQAMPIYPDGYITKDTVTDLIPTEVYNAIVYFLESPTYIMTQTRKFEIVMHLYNGSDKEWIDQSQTIYGYAGLPLSFYLFSTTQGLYQDGAWIAGATIDDDDFGGWSIEIPQMPLTLPGRSAKLIIPEVYSLFYSNDQVELSFRDLHSPGTLGNLAGVLTYFDTGLEKWTIVEGNWATNAKPYKVYFPVGPNASFPPGSVINYNHGNSRTSGVDLLEYYDITSLGSQT